MRTKVYVDDVLLQFCDDANVIHEVSLKDVLLSGIPLDEETEEEMEFIQAFILA